MDDYYCKICKAHMNSQDMWESHISGKRHLKNVKKELEAPHPPRKERDNEDPFEKMSCYAASDAAGTAHRSHHRSRSPISDRSRSHSPHFFRKKSSTSTSSVDGKWRHDRYYMLEHSPPAPPCSSTTDESELNRLTEDFSTSEKLDLLKKLSERINVVSDDDVRLLKAAITSLYEDYLLHKMNELPHSAKNKKANYRH